MLQLKRWLVLWAETPHLGHISKTGHVVVQDSTISRPESGQLTSCFPRQLLFLDCDAWWNVVQHLVVWVGLERDSDAATNCFVTRWHCSSTGRTLVSLWRWSRADIYKLPVPILVLDFGYIGDTSNWLRWSWGTRWGLRSPMYCEWWICKWWEVSLCLCPLSCRPMFSWCWVFSYTLLLCPWRAGWRGILCHMWHQGAGIFSSWPSVSCTPWLRVWYRPRR